MTRLADRIGVSPARLAAIVGLDHPGCATTPVDLGRLAEFAGTSTESMTELSYRPVSRKGCHRFGASLIQRDILDLSGRQVCPECLTGSDHHRRLWDLSLMTACPVHGLRLVGDCPRCRRRLGWRERSASACMCGHDLRTCEPAIALVGETGANRRLVEIASADRPTWLPEELASCPAPDLMWLATCLGMFMAGWPRPRRAPTLRKCAPSVRADVLIAGMDALAEWPGPLSRFLARERSKTEERPGRFGANKTFGPFYAWMRGIEYESVRGPVLVVARRFAEEDTLSVHRMHRSKLLAGVGSEGDVTNLATAAKLLGQSKAAARSMLLGTDAGRQRGVPLVISRRAVDRLRTYRDALLTLRETARRLGISRKQVGEIVDGDLLRPAVVPEWAGAAGSAVDGRKVADLLARLEARVRSDEGSGTMVTFQAATRAVGRCGADVGTLLGLILSGRLVPVGLDIGQTGLRRLRFDESCLRKICRELHEPTHLTIQGAAERLGLKWEVVAHLSKAGIVESFEGKIKADALSRFVAEFVSGVELADDRRTSPRALAASLQRRGVKPVSGPSVDDGRQNFYRRRDIAELDSGGAT